MDKKLVVVCSRCGVSAVVKSKACSGALILKRASSAACGLCANCAITELIKRSPQLMQGVARHGPELFLNPMVQDGFARLLSVGNSDAEPSEIDWQRVVDNWDLPITKCKKGV